jgi:hypothetical protein
MLLERAFLGVYPVLLQHQLERGKLVAGRGRRRNGLLVVGWKERIGRRKKRVGRKIGQTGALIKTLLTLVVGGGTY